MTRVSEQIEIGWTPAAPGSDTSSTAAQEKAKRGTAAKDRNRVLRRICSCPSTDEDLTHALDMSGNSVRPRRGECVSRKWVVDSGRRRPTSSGRPATVWEATDLGREVLKGLR